MEYHRGSVGRNVIVVGGGLAGLAASLYLARGGRTVTLFEKRRFLGGRAITTLRHGYRFNLGAHAFYRAGHAAAVCRELGIPIRGSVAKFRARALSGDEQFLLPVSFWSLIATQVVGLRGKSELIRALWQIRRRGGAGAEGMSTAQWLDARFQDDRARATMAALLRLASYSDHAEKEEASLTLAQMRVAMRRAIYVDEGWQKIVDALHSAAVSAGVNFVTSSRVVGIHHDGSVRGVELGGLELDADRMDTQALAWPLPKPEEVSGTRVPAETVLLTVDPASAAEVAGDVGSAWTGGEPVTAACLDVALRALPQPRNLFAIGIDRPVYYAVHSRFAQLTPKGGALVHLVKYRKDADATEEAYERSGDPRRGQHAADEEELEALLDSMQPGWREVLVHRRFLPAMTVANSFVPAGGHRPSVATPVKGLFIAGDWVGSEGLLSDAALASARAAAKAILATD